MTAASAERPSKPSVRTLARPTIRTVPRAQHPISRKLLSPNAVRVLYRLINAGFEAYVVGGCVRDLLLERIPKDFDVVTNARPEEIRDLFRSSRLIGRRFRLAHVRMGGEIIEVSTFRKLSASPQGSSEDNGDIDNSNDGEGSVVRSAAGVIVEDNVYGTFEDDVLRRDFTINALYYTPKDFCLYDSVGGLEDIEQRLLRVIGDATLRYREDPVRMLRAVRLAAKLDLTIEEHSLKPIAELAPLIAEVPPARLADEMSKMFLSGHALKTWHWLRSTALFAELMPATAAVIDAENELLFELAMRSTDARIAEDRSVTLGFLYAVLLWPVFQARLKEVGEDQEAARLAVAAQNRVSSVPARHAQFARETWELQAKMERPSARRLSAVLNNPRFRAAYDLIQLRSKAGFVDESIAKFWTEVQGVDGEARNKLVRAIEAPRPRTRRRRRRTAH